MVDDLNPVLNFTRREVENLLHFVEEESDPAQLSLSPSKMKESVLQLACLKYPHLITKVRPICVLAGIGRRSVGVCPYDGDVVAKEHNCVLVPIGKKSSREDPKNPALLCNVLCALRATSVTDSLGAFCRACFS